jgi:hypothetical protein
MTRQDPAAAAVTPVKPDATAAMSGGPHSAAATPWGQA